MVSEKIKGNYLDDLNNVIALKLKKKFIKKIFKRDDRRYQKFVGFINDLSNWKQASVAIDEMFYQTGVNPYSKVAIEFSDLIYNRYFPKESREKKEEFH